MKLAEFLAEYLANGIDRLHKAGMPVDFNKEGLQDPIQAGIEAFVEAKEMDIAIVGFNEHGKFVQTESYRYER